MKRFALWTPALVIMLSVSWLRPAAAQIESQSQPDAHIDLAAMALPSGSMPDGYGLAVENYHNGQAYAASIYSNQQDTTRLLNTGLVVVYNSSYSSAAGDQTIRSYIEQFGTPTGAKSGYDILENGSNFDPSQVTARNEPLTGLGDGPGQITIYNVKSQNGSEPTDGVDATFRVENYLAGVTLESTNGSPPAQADAITLSRVLEGRIRKVIGGKPISGIESSLPLKLLQLNYTPLDEGYVSSVDSFGSVSTDKLFKGYKSGYSRTSALGQRSRPVPLVFDTVSTWASEHWPLQIISGGDKYQPPYTKLKQVDIEPIAGASAVVGYHFVSPLGDGKTIDSFRVLATTGSNLITIDIQAASSEAVAQRLALDFAKAQLACVDKGNCPVIDNVDTGS